MIIRTPNEVRADILTHAQDCGLDKAAMDKLGEQLTEHAFASRAAALRATADVMKRWLTEENDLGEGRINQICAMIWGGA